MNRPYNPTFKVYCIGCGIDLHAKREWAQRHCDKSECIQKWCESVIEESTHQEGEHLIWDRSVRYTNTPYIGVTPWSASGDINKHNKINRRVLDILDRQHGGTGNEGTPWVKLCDVPHCVRFDHWEKPTKEWQKPDPPSLYISARLPAQPLLDELERQKAHGVIFGTDFPSQKISEGRRLGWLTVTQVDLLCCDWLKVHPVQLYGDLFFTVSDEMYPCGHPRTDENSYKHREPSGYLHQACRQCQLKRRAAARAARKVAA